MNASIGTTGVDRPKMARARKPAVHPNICTMVMEAVKRLNKRDGVSLTAIKKYISEVYKVDTTEKIAYFIRKAITTAVANGKLVQVKGSASGANGAFTLPLSSKVAVADKPKHSKSVNPIMVKAKKNESRTEKEGEEFRYPCGFCDSAFSSFDLRTEHTEEVHGHWNHFQELKCKYCGRMFNKSLHGLYIHFESHFKIKNGNEKPFKCSLCNGQYNDKIGLQSHIRRYHKDHKNTINYESGEEKKPRLECGICGLNFLCTESFRKHRVDSHNHLLPEGTTGTGCQSDAIGSSRKVEAEPGTSFLSQLIGVRVKEEEIEAPFLQPELVPILNSEPEEFVFVNYLKDSPLGEDGTSMSCTPAAIRLFIIEALEFQTQNLIADPGVSYEHINSYLEETFNVKTDCLSVLNQMVREEILTQSVDGKYSKRKEPNVAVKPKNSRSKGSGATGTLTLPSQPSVPVKIDADDSKSMLTVEKNKDKSREVEDPGKGEEFQYECGFCDSSFSSYVLRNEHTDEVHSHIQEFRCKYCGRLFQSKLNLYPHFEIHSKNKDGTEKPFKCSVCNGGFNQKSQLTKHFRNTHTDLGKIEERESKPLKYSKKSLSKLKPVDEEKENFNRLIEEVLKTDEDSPVGFWDIHKYLDNLRTKWFFPLPPRIKRFLQRNVQNGRVVRTRGRGNRTRYRYRLANPADLNERQRNDDQLVKKPGVENQDHLDRIGTQRQELNRFRASQESSPSIPEPKFHNIRCKYCGQLFWRKTSLMSHLRIHSKDAQERRFKCSVCNGGFAGSSDLATHFEKAHSGKNKLNDEPTFECEICPLNFSSLELLGMHMEHTHKPSVPLEGVLECGMCPETFVNYEDRLKHSSEVHKKHTHRLQCYTCKICGWKIHCISGFYNHFNRHTDGKYKPHKCPHCHLGFSSSKQLKKHSIHVHRTRKRRVKSTRDSDLESFIKSEPGADGIHSDTIISLSDAVGIQSDNIGNSRNGETTFFPCQQPDVRIKEEEDFMSEWCPNLSLGGIDPIAIRSEFVESKPGFDVTKFIDENVDADVICRDEDDKIKLEEIF